MMAFMKKLWRDKRGNALIIAAGALPLVIGSAGLASDTIQWTLWKRQLQRAADSAAIAAVYDRIDKEGSTANVPAAVNDDLARHNHTKIALLGAPQLAYPPGLNWTNPVRVTLSLQNKLGFSSVFMSTPPIITTSATAATVATGVYCVVSLIDTDETGIKMTGNGDIDLGCGMITNSTSLDAAIATGSSEVNATPVAARGDIQASDNWGGAKLLPFTGRQKDPFAEVEPDTSSCTGSDPVLTQNTPTADIKPGCYSGIDLNGTVNLPSGTYIIDGGPLEFGNKANVTCLGCTFVLTNSDPASTDIGSVDFDAQAFMNLTAPDDPSHPYDGIAIYQDRRAELGEVNKINGGSGAVIEGALYFPRQQLILNGGSGLTFTCGRFVALIVEFSGNSTIKNTIDSTCPNSQDPGFMGRHVRLVA